MDPLWRLPGLRTQSRHSNRNTWALSAKPLNRRSPSATNRAASSSWHSSRANPETMMPLASASLHSRDASCTVEPNRSLWSSTGSPASMPIRTLERLGRVGVVGGKSPLDIGGGAHRVRDIVERGHDAVAGVLDLAPAIGLKPAPDQRVVRPHEFERRAVAEARRHLGRTDDVGEHDGAQPRIHGGRGRARRRLRIADAAEERFDGGKIDRNDGVGNCAMRLAMDPLGGRGVRRMDEAEGRRRCPHRTNRPCI